MRTYYQKVSGPKQMLRSINLEKKSGYRFLKRSDTIDNQNIKNVKLMRLAFFVLTFKKNNGLF